MVGSRSGIESRAPRTRVNQRYPDSLAGAVVVVFSILFALTITSSWLRSVWFYRAIVVLLVLLFGLVASWGVASGLGGIRSIVSSAFFFGLFFYFYSHLFLMREHFLSVSPPAALRAKVEQQGGGSLFERMVVPLPRLLFVVVLILLCWALVGKRA